jgi:hypothetical protein
MVFWYEGLVQATWIKCYDIKNMKKSFDLQAVMLLSKFRLKPGNMLQKWAESYFCTTVKKTFF